MIRKYLPEAAKELKENLTIALGQNYLSFAADETTDRYSRHPTTFVCRINHPFQNLTLDLQFLDFVNHATMLTAFDKIVQEYSIQKYQIDGFCSDSAAYMVKFKTLLNELFP